jgi:N-carbamoyl-L-amino-acid hydrolase
MKFPKSARINGKRLWSTIKRSGEIGKGREGGLARLALTDSDKKIRDLFVKWCREAKLTVSIDRLGSIFGRRAGREDNLPPVLLGSHLDTQANGGRFDGILGVLGALELVRTLNDLNYTTRRPIEIVDWTNEEGSRFSPAMVAAGAFAGTYKEDWVLARPGDDGPTLGEELKRIGYAGDAPVGGRPIDSCFELHIEQGPILDAEKVLVGICTGAMYATGNLVEYRGETAHTGPWPMERRRNALLAGARLLDAVDDIGWEFAGTGGKATAARLVAWPNKGGIISDWAQAIVDVRHDDPQTETVMAERMRRAIFEAGARSNCEAEILDTWTWGGPIFDNELNDLARRKCDELGHSRREMVSVSGHDAYFIARLCPTTMIFVPSRGGITHNNAELSVQKETEPGANVFLHSVVAHADR